VTGLIATWLGEHDSNTVYENIYYVDTNADHDTDIWGIYRNSLRGYKLAFTDNVSSSSIAVDANYIYAIAYNNSIYTIYKYTKAGILSSYYDMDEGVTLYSIDVDQDYIYVSAIDDIDFNGIIRITKALDAQTEVYLAYDVDNGRLCADGVYIWVLCSGEIVRIQCSNLQVSTHYSIDASDICVNNNYLYTLESNTITMRNKRNMSYVNSIACTSNVVNICVDDLHVFTLTNEFTATVRKYLASDLTYINSNSTIETNYPSHTTPKNIDVYNYTNNTPNEYYKFGEVMNNNYIYIVWQIREYGQYFFPIEKKDAVTLETVDICWDVSPSTHGALVNGRVYGCTDQFLVCIRDQDMVWNEEEQKWELLAIIPPVFMWLDSEDNYSVDHTSAYTWNGVDGSGISAGIISTVSTWGGPFHMPTYAYKYNMSSNTWGDVMSYGGSIDVGDATGPADYIYGTYDGHLCMWEYETGDKTIGAATPSFQYYTEGWGWRTAYYYLNYVDSEIGYAGLSTPIFGNDTRTGWVVDPINLTYTEI
jgi:hypothetical protein